MPADQSRGLEKRLNRPLGSAGVAVEADEGCRARNGHGRVPLVAVTEIERNRTRAAAARAAAILVQGASPRQHIHRGFRAAEIAERNPLRAGFLAVARFRARGARQPFRENDKITGSFSSRKTRNRRRDDSRLKMGSRLIHEPFHKVRVSQSGGIHSAGWKTYSQARKTARLFNCTIRADDLEIRSKQFKATGLERFSANSSPAAAGISPLEAELDLAQMAGRAASVGIPVFFKPSRSGAIGC